jgi:hypothetical protein
MTSKLCLFIIINDPNVLINIIKSAKARAKQMRSSNNEELKVKPYLTLIDGLTSKAK